MREKSAMSGSGVFLIELLLAILIFAVASAVCLKIFVTAHQVSTESSKLNQAVIAAQSAAECFKAAKGNIGETATLLGTDSEVSADSVIVRFDETWDVLPQESAYEYVLELKRLSAQSGCIDGEVEVCDVWGGLIFSIPVSVMEVAR